jgi:hypothetical protein
MAFDTERVDESILALLALFAFEETRSWKSYDWEAMERLHAKGLIENPVNKNKSVHLSAEGLAKGRAAAERLFGASWSRRS